MQPIEPQSFKRRNRLTKIQLDTLTETLEQTYFPSTEQRNSLAIKVGMTPRAVQVWFQNKRQAHKQKLQKIKEKINEERYERDVGYSNELDEVNEVSILEFQRSRRESLPSLNEVMDPCLGQYLLSNIKLCAPWNRE